MFTFDPGFTSTASTESKITLHRRRRGRAALSRLSHRSNSPSTATFWRPAISCSTGSCRPRAEGRFRPPRDAPHDGARADVAVLPGLPPRRASDVGDGRLRRRARRVLSRFHRHQRPLAARDRLDPHDRQSADAGGDGLQIFDRPAVRLSEELARLRQQFPAHVLCRAVRGIRGQSGAGARARPHLHPARRSRAERLDLDGAARRLLRRQPVRLHRRRHRLPLGSRRTAAPTRRR